MALTNNNINDINSGIQNAYIDSCIDTNLAFSPQFLTNNHHKGTKVLTYIENELLHCDEFCISVAFINRSGFVVLSQTLKELEKKGIRGRILTTDYLTFSDPYALDRLAKLKNVELKMYHVKEAGIGFHTKGYLFKEEGTYRIIIGSSNMTQTALTTNMEWNTALVSTDCGAMAKSIVNEFESLWNDSASRDYREIRKLYIKQYDRKKQIDKLIKSQHKIALEEDIVELDTYNLKPNKMQETFIGNIHELRECGEKRALLISATGTGKTYASAFAMKNENPNKALFIVHRELIAKQAMKSYRKVFGTGKKMALLSGNSKEYDADILFATMNMMAKPETFEYLKKHNIHYDWICIDEVHRAGSKSYQRIMEYFKPDFWLGMTASPERMDGFDIFELFDHNIAYEIRLQHALKEDLLCPFHYFGITDIEINGEVINRETELNNFKYLVSNQRVNHILKNANFYGHSGDRVKGLVFCSGKKEALELSSKFQEQGYYARTLFGEDRESVREECVELLSKDVDVDVIKNHHKDIENKKAANEKNMPFLDYIFTVDIFNEGVDIPEINQVIMLRETQSPIVFVQQLGRGLRKAEDKDYVVIIDFIGNYNNNYMIPIALSGDRSYNKDSMRRYVKEGTRIIPGVSTIHFDEISRQKIFKSIDSAKTNEIKLLKQSFEQLKYRLGRIPTVLDFKEYGSIDVSKYFEKCGSYYAFLVKYYGDEYKVRLNSKEEEIIEFLSKKVTRMKRIHELLLLKELIEHNNWITVYFKTIMTEHFHVNFDEKVEQSVYRNLTNQFPKEGEKKKYSNCVLIDKTQGGYQLSSNFRSLLMRNKDFYEMVCQVVEYGISLCKELYCDNYRDTNLSLYQKYTYEDVCRLLNWQKNINAQGIGGYHYDAETKTLPVFINYDKTEDAIAYEDRFISSKELIALSKHPRKVNSSDADHFYKRTKEDKDNRILLFVRKNKDDKEAKEFYFLGEVFAKDEPIPVKMEKTGDDAFEIRYQLDVPVREDIYEYLVSEA
ncbi:Superfamily II DNA or RNA helicase [Acetitomaculum ruminis DSM 5522]|uniref:Superfamily II DNA or RNA helicase n=1 Tax=Acetitomaculum ruminis DSM 5522 TaxID=1120918 RepID=A0A1I0WEN3_9FIRM|nr:DEAD/DEAH box helicase [Acetitomaculum ruminis]SFA86877.1 Superfamily II DNA or RNA helicase [Acetitomaculum ruminis DSM 5522]